MFDQLMRIPASFSTNLHDFHNQKHQKLSRLTKISKLFDQLFSVKIFFVCAIQEKLLKSCDKANRIYLIESHKLFYCYGTQRCTLLTQVRYEIKLKKCLDSD